MSHVELVTWGSLSDAQQEQVRGISVSAQQVEYAGRIDSQLASVEAESGADLVGLAALRDGEVMAFLTLKRRSKAPTWASEGLAVISAMRVDTALQGRGMGRLTLLALPTWVENNWPECHGLALSVDEDNHQGIKAYAAAGFADLGQRVQGRVGWVRYMSKPLRPSTRAT